MNKILININNLEEVDYYKKVGITNFLFAIENFSIGYKTFNIDEIPKDAYILINRVLDSNDVDNLKKIKDKLSCFKGIIYEDIAVYQIFKEEDIELIWFQNHFETNANSINFWLDKGCTSSLISNEITEEEILYIIENSHKPLVLNIFGKNQIMYSRRTLLTNFNKYNNLDNYNDMVIKPINKTDEFMVRENEFGTVIFNNTYFNYISLLDKINDEKIKFYLVLNLDLKEEEIKEIIIDKKPYGNNGFLNKKTVYRMSEYDDR